MAVPVLNVHDLTMQFGGVVAVDNLNLTVYPQEIIGLIGPNGAGKTTAFNVISGIYEPTNGSIDINGETVLVSHPKGSMKKKYKGRNLGKYTETKLLSPDRVCALGVARTFQNIRLFKGMTVLENVMTAMHKNQESGVLSVVLRSVKAKNEERIMRDEALTLLRKVGLYEHRDDMATSLPYGKQRRLEIARALATHPDLLLLDEPAAGMNPQESDDLMHFIGRIREEFSLSILMIEHHMQVIMGICDRIYVLNYGGQIADGTPEEIQSNQAVIDAYLGGE